MSGLPEIATNDELNNEVIFYAIDKASLYALAKFPSTNSLALIADWTLARLQITDQDKSLMWLWINAHSAPYGASPVDPGVASDAQKVSDVIIAVYDTIKGANK